MTRIRVEHRAGVSSADAVLDETILGALLRSGVDVPHCCRRGTCGMCASVLLDGEVERIAVRSDGPTLLALPSDQVLICSARALTDCLIRPVHALAGCERGLRVSVDTCRVLADSAVHLRVVPTAAVPFSFRAGQQVRVEFPPSAGDCATQLYIASRPGMFHMDFYLPLDEWSGRLAASLLPGDALVLHEPMGSCSLGVDETQPVIVVAEGRGLASALGMIEMLAVAPRTAFVFLIGSPAGGVARLALAKAARAGTHAVLLDSPRELAAAIHETAAAQPPPQRVRGCIKGVSETVKLARAALLKLGVRPWDIHVDPLE